MSEIERRIRLARIGKRDPDKDLAEARNTLKNAKKAFDASKDRKGIPSYHASDTYAKALRDVQIAEAVLDEIERLEEIA